jgi:hypothetical protein
MPDVDSDLDGRGLGPFVGTLVWETFAEPKRQWVDEAGVEHIRGQASTGKVTGELEFAASNEFNSDWDPAALTGRVFGAYTFASLEETWKGHFAGSMNAETSRGTWDGQSDLGRKLAGTFNQVGEGTYDCEWFILGFEE